MAPFLSEPFYITSLPMKMSEEPININGFPGVIYTETRIHGSHGR
jgi:hypothetical protein